MTNEMQTTRKIFDDAELHLMRIQLALDLAEYLFNCGFGVSRITDRHVRVYLSSRRLPAHEVQLTLTDDYAPFVTVKQEINSVLITLIP